MTLTELKRELIGTAIIVAGAVGLRLFPYSLVIALWNGRGFDAAMAAYQAMVQSRAIEFLVFMTLLVVFVRVGTWFEHRAKEPRYSDREDGYKAGGHD